MKNFIIITMILAILIPIPSKAFNQEESRLIVLAFDVVFNGLKSGIGASYNGNDFWPAFAKGALSGIVVHAGKELASWNGPIPFAGATGGYLHDLGVSMSDNVMKGLPMLSHYRTEIGFMEIDFSKSEINAYILPGHLYSIIKNISDGGNIDIKHSLQYMSPIFYTNNTIGARAKPKGYRFNAVALSGTVIYDEEIISLDSTLSHEFQHILFQRSLRFCDYIIEESIGKNSNIIENIPIINPISKWFNHIHYGTLVGDTLLLLPSLIDPALYYWTPTEIHSYTMQRQGHLPNWHPLYNH